MKIPCWIETHRRLNWRMARRIVSSPEKGGPENFSIGIPDSTDNSIKTRRQVGRPKRRWEDDINEFLKPDEIRKTRYDLMNNNSWMTDATNIKNGRKRKTSSQRNGSKCLGSNSLNSLDERFAPKPSLSGFFRFNVFGCTETCNCGTGRILSARIPVQVLHALPQDAQSSRFRINTTTLRCANADVSNVKSMNGYDEIYQKTQMTNN